VKLSGRARVALAPFSRRAVAPAFTARTARKMEGEVMSDKNTQSVTVEINGDYKELELDGETLRSLRRGDVSPDINSLVRELVWKHDASFDPIGPNHPLRNNYHEHGGPPWVEFTLRISPPGSFDCGKCEGSGETVNDTFCESCGGSGRLE